MAKLTRPTDTKIFGSTALAAELTTFGSSVPSTDINLILNSVEAQRGWGTIGANGFPPMEWFNALGYGLSYYNAYLMQQGIPEWTALQNYYINSYCVGSDGKQYRSKTGVSGTPNVGNNPVGDSVNWSIPISDTAPQFNNDTSIATTEFVQRALGNSSGVVSPAGSVSLTPADVGKVISCAIIGAMTVTLPPISGLPNGSTITILNYGTGVVSVVAGAGGTINNSNLLSPLSVGINDSIELTLVGTIWRPKGISELPYSSLFGALKATSGYQKLPSGIIIQWGTTPVLQSTGVTVNFPIAFPNSCRVVTLTRNGGDSQAVSMSTSLSPASFTGYATLANTVATYVAIGY